MENEQQNPDGNISDEASVISDVTHEEESEISISKTRQMLSDAESLMKEIEEMLQHCASIDSAHRRHRVIQQVCEANIVEDGETLVVEGFRFVSAENTEELKKLSFQAGAEQCQGSTSKRSGVHTKGHQNKKAYKGKGVGRKAKN